MPFQATLERLNYQFCIPIHPSPIKTWFVNAVIENNFGEKQNTFDLGNIYFDRYLHDLWLTLWIMQSAYLQSHCFFTTHSKDQLSTSTLSYLEFMCGTQLCDGVAHRDPIWMGTLLEIGLSYPKGQLVFLYNLKAKVTLDSHHILFCWPRTLYCGVKEPSTHWRDFWLQPQCLWCRAQSNAGRHVRIYRNAKGTGHRGHEGNKQEQSGWHYACSDCCPVPKCFWNRRASISWKGHIALQIWDKQK